MGLSSNLPRLMARVISLRDDPRGARHWGASLVWGFSCQAVVLGCAEVFCSERERPFFVPSPGIRFAERAEGVKGPKRQQSLAACRLSAACVSQRPLFKPGAGFDA